MSQNHKVTLYTDGGCRGNPGKGGWGAVLIWGDHVKEMSGSEPDTTNNRMELKAAIEGLTALKRPVEVEVYTDSKYVQQGISDWITNWKRKGWKTANGKAVKNKDLWQALDNAIAKHKIEWKWVKGHAGNKWNERADQLANQAMDAMKS